MNIDPNAHQLMKYSLVGLDSSEPYDEKQLNYHVSRILCQPTFSMVPAAKPTTMARPFQAIHFKESVLIIGAIFGR